MSAPDPASREALRERGRAVGRALDAEGFDAQVEGLRRDFDPDLADLYVETFFGRVLARPALDLATRQLVTVAALARQGSPPELEWHLAGALRIGVPKEALREALIMVIPYCGWTAGLRALRVLRAVVLALNPDAPHPLLGAVPVTGEAMDRARLHALGRRNATTVNAAFPKVEATLDAIDADLAPTLLESAYAQVYGRPGLDLRGRELVSVALLAVGEQLPQLKYHITGALNAGATEAEVKEVLLQMGLLAGWPTVLNGLTVWKDVVERRAQAR